MEPGRQPLGVGAAIARRFETLQVDRLVRRSNKGTGRYTVIALVEPLAQRILPVVYVHREYEERLGATVEWAKRHLPESYEYTVVKLNQRNDSVSFILCPDFDLEHEPAIAGIIVVSADGVTQRRTTPADPYIYHHKWLFVDDDYRGFNVDESKARSLHWISLGDVDRSRIGRASYWNEQVIPRLSRTIPERWVRSNEVRRQLKLSTCDLAHAREAGEIEFKKVGNAFLYKLPQCFVQVKN